MYGDFYTVTGNRVTEDYNNDLQKISKDFSFYVKDKILTYNGKDLTHWFRNEPTEDPVIIARVPFSMQNLNECLKAIAGIFGIII